MTQAEWKIKAVKEMKAYLETAIGYPACDGRSILQHLIPMYRLLEEKKLILKGQTYEAFAREAHHKFMEYEMRRILGI